MARKATPSNSTASTTPMLIGSTGLVRYGGQIGRVEDEWHPNLRGQLAARVYREMGDNDASLGSAVNLMKFTLRQVPWRAQEAHGGDRAKESAERLTGMFDDMEHSFGAFMLNVLSKIQYGFAPFEIGYKQRRGKQTDKRVSSKFNDGLIGWRGFFPRAQESIAGWRFDDEGNTVGMYQDIIQPKMQRVYIPIDKLLLFRTESNKNSPEGRSWFRCAYRSWFFLKRLQEIEAIGIERELNGLVVIRLPVEICDERATPAQKNLRARYDKVAMQIRRNAHEGVTFPTSLDRQGKPTGFDIGLLSSSGTRAIDIGESIRRYENRIAMVFGAQFQLFGAEKQGGNRSISGDMTDMFGLMMGAVLDEAEEVLAPEVDRIQEYNGEAPEDRAKWVHGDIEKKQIDKLSQALKVLADGGYINPDGDLELENYLRGDVLDVPLRSEDAELPDEEQLDEPVADAELDDLTADAKKSAPTFIPSEEMAKNASAALRVRDRLPAGKRAMGVVNLARARDIAARKAIPVSTVKRMRDFFTKHQSAKGPSWERGGRNWQVAMGLGGDAGREWAKTCLGKAKPKKEQKEACTECGAVLIEYEPGEPCPECGVELRISTKDLPVPPAHPGIAVVGALARVK